MEQQTVSIAKGGITTSLNARTSVLAAGNPLYGRYNLKKSPSENINLPSALLSRFDLMFLLVDRPNYDDDLALAKHITYVHRHRRNPKMDFTPLSSAFIRAYISQARQMEPFVPEALTSYVVETYVAMRQGDAKTIEAFNSGGKTNPAALQGMMTARQLLSILRLAQALARLRFSKEVRWDGMGWDVM